MLLTILSFDSGTNFDSRSACTSRKEVWRNRDAQLKYQIRALVDCKILFVHFFKYRPFGWNIRTKKLPSFVLCGIAFFFSTCMKFCQLVINPENGWFSLNTALLLPCTGFLFTVQLGALPLYTLDCLLLYLVIINYCRLI